MSGIEKHLEYLITAPTICKWRPLFLNADNLSHVLIGRIGGHQVVIGQLILLHNSCQKNVWESVDSLGKQAAKNF